MRASLCYLPTVGDRSEIEQGGAGLRPELYQRMLAEISGQARLADEQGYHSLSFTEHHVHIEGLEIPAKVGDVLEPPRAAREMVPAP
jgi:hypothetical protein